MQLSFWAAITSLWRPIPEVSTFSVDLTGKVVIVTGANVGLGFETAKHLATMNPTKIILACRNAQKGDQAAAVIGKATSCSTVVCWPVDISDPASVKAFAERFEREGGGKLDIMVENAGVNTFSFKRAVSGYEQTVATNHLGTAHLAFRMLPFLLKAEKPRLVIVASDVHYWCAEPEETDSDGLLQKMNEEGRSGKFYAMGNRYPASKLLNILFTRAFATHLPPGTALTVNAVNPSLCQSELGREFNPLLVFLAKFLARTTEMGSRMFVHAAVAREMEGKNGEYMFACAVDEPSDFVLSDRGASASKRLWSETIEILSEQDGKVLENVKRYLK